MSTLRPDIRALAIVEQKGKFHYLKANRRDYADPDETIAVTISIDYCGVCHTDLHFVRGDWGEIKGNLVPGHEIVGTVASVGPGVTKFKIGDRVGVGCITDSCGACFECKDGHEQLCDGRVLTYQESIPKPATDPKVSLSSRKCAASAAKTTAGHGTASGPAKGEPTVTLGGYSSSIVVPEHFVLRVPDSISSAEAAPLLCAGATTFYPLKHVLGKGDVSRVAGTRVGIVGFGGLGHVAVMLAAKMGADVVVFSTSERKREEAMKLGSHSFVVTSPENPPKVEEIGGPIDLMIDTVSANHPIEHLLGVVSKRGAYHLVGLPPDLKFAPMHAVWHNRNVTTSLIAGIADTQEMLDFCGRHEVRPWIELAPCADIEKVYQRLEQNDVKFRFVLDIKGSLAAAERTLPAAPTN